MASIIDYKVFGRPEVTLVWHFPHFVFFAHVLGEMSFCPGYLSITINDLQDAEELFRYDALIFCPTSFNMSFKVPNRGQKPDRTFQMRLEDAKKSYRQVQYQC